MENNVKLSIKSVADSVKNSVSEILSNSDFLSRTIGMNNSYEDITFLVQALGRKPISLLGKDYAFIFDHVRRNYMQGTEIPSTNFDFCNKFTFYKEIPSVKFANVEEDPMNLKDRWVSNFKTEPTIKDHTEYSYAEVGENEKNGGNVPDGTNANQGISDGIVGSFQYNLKKCDLIGKTNSNFKHGKYETLIARFHTDTQESKDLDDATQTAKSRKYGLSHGRNLLKLGENKKSYGYDNPYCRVWTYHHQYSQIKDQIRPFEEATTQEMLESMEEIGDYSYSGFRTIPSSTYGTIGGSKSLDKYGVLNYSNGTVNIAPTAKIKDYFDKGEGKDGELSKDKIEIKKCMFSIENLAWKDDGILKRNEFEPYGLSAEQKGPLGGRIMWFPPYNLEFNEQVSVRWNENEFIGRGEKVYTYTNTERTGNLKFTLLIDHPSILDYWSGHDRNGMTNQGVQLSQGRGDGIDDINSQENTLLRFFAGCEILTSTPQKFEYKIEDETTEQTEKERPDQKPKKRICAVLYFPNNYSGVDDWESEINPVYYLMNGVGAQYVYFDGDKETSTTTTSLEQRPIVFFGSNINDRHEVGGYEIDEKYGISLVDGVLRKDEEIRKSVFVKNDKNEYVTWKADDGKIAYEQYLTNSDGTKIGYDDGNKNEKGYGYLIKNTTTSSPNPKNTKKILTNDWLQFTYYFRLDYAYFQEYPNNPQAYIDLKSFGLNDFGFNKIRNDVKLSERMHVEKQDSDDFILVSFTDLFDAVMGNENKAIIGNNPKYVQLIKDILVNKNKKYSDIDFKFYGNASKPGYGKFNKKLAKERANTIKKWLAKSLKDKDFEDKISQAETIYSGTTSGPIAGGDQSTLENKLWRCASVVIEYNEQGVMEAAIAETPTVEVEKDSDGNTVKDSNGNAVPVKDAEGKVVPSTERIESDNKETSVKYSEQEVIEKTNISPNDLNKSNKSNDTVKRYDNEGEFFQVLSENEPFLHHLISEKVKYFDPAFHSISPEGFNARLTFLHQCTRQGSTTEKSSTGEVNTAYNLSFGRPPVCVLRIGDFYYTKIIIKSLNIDYNQHNWDMNPEGIGMMPMYADININFAFLGGSDIAGPIARLQNAVSFNYYANTSVYDNRAEKVEYNPNGSGEEIAFKPFNYPNKWTKE